MNRKIESQKTGAKFDLCHYTQEEKDVELIEELEMTINQDY